MNIQLLDSHLREFLHTKATPKELARQLSLTSVSVERLEKYKANDYLYDIEVTTNRPDLMSAVGLAREAAPILQQAGIHATFIPPHLPSPKKLSKEQATITIHNDQRLVNRICGVIMEVTQQESPAFIKERLEASGIRSLNNLVDITNYVMRTIGHPTHVFDYDRLLTKKLLIREAKKGEKIVTLDGKAYTLPGGDIVADDGTGQIVDLLGVMGTANSVVTSETKRILFFLDNNDPHKIRKTSMSLGIRTDAAVLNEKGIDPELAMDALLYGIQLYEKFAKGQQLSNITDIYPTKVENPVITVSEEKINAIIGITIPLTTAGKILDGLGFETKTHEGAVILSETRNPVGNKKDASAKSLSITVTVPSWRAHDIQIEEDIIEEIARVYGYHNIPSVLPMLAKQEPVRLTEDEFFWETYIKEALKYWGFTEVYTYSMVSENMLETPVTHAIALRNPLTDDMSYMRTTLMPSLLQVVKENATHDSMKIFELSNVYIPKANDLPVEKRMLAGIVKKPSLSFFAVKGIVEQLLHSIGIEKILWKVLQKGGSGTSVYIQSDYVGDIEILDTDLIDFELDFAVLLKHATLKKSFKPLAKYPPIVEDHTIIADEKVATGDIMELIERQSPLITAVSLLDKYENARTFHIVYQDKTKNLTNEEVGEIRKKILKSLKDKFGARLK